MIVINPIGNRLGRIMFWSYTSPITYYSGFQGSDIGSAVRLLVHCWFLAIRKPHQKQGKKVLENFYDRRFEGLLIDVFTNIYGFKADKLMVHIALHDYRLIELILKKNGLLRWLFKRFIKYWFINFMVEKKLSPSVYGGRPKLRGTKYLRKRRPNRRSVRSFAWRLRRFVRRYFKKVRVVVGKRLANWHRLLVVFLKPYLVRLMRQYSIRRGLIYTWVQNPLFMAGVVARYIVIRLRQNTPINFLIRRIRYSLASIRDSETKRAIGYKICFAGRFSRRQIATYRWVREDSVPLNTFSGQVDYAYEYSFTKFGMIGFKIWIYHGLV